MADSSRIWAGKSDQLQGKSPSSFDDKRLIAVSLLVALLVCALGLVIAWSAIGRLMGAASDGSEHLASMPNPVNASVNNADTHFNVNVVGEPAIGPENAPVTIVEFGDFQCPFCKRFYADVEEALFRKYKGKIRFVFRDFPMLDIHPLAGMVAEAAHCAGDQGKFWEYHDLAFQTQPQRDKADMFALAKRLNLDITVFKDCMDTRKYVPHVVADHCDGLSLGITGTPTFFINGRKLVGAQSLSTFSAYIDAELGNSMSTPVTK